MIEGEIAMPQSLEHLAQRLKWHGISVETRSLARSSRPLAQKLTSAAIDLHADLLVVGAYGHRRLREVVFGGVTQSLLEQASIPVFMMH
jgi:nucleotide-binding universal stress UspA family protein